MHHGEVLCVGELLWDSLPAGLFLGGAPFNVACGLRAAGVGVAVVSRVGSDRLGQEAVHRAAAYGVGTDLVQTDATLPTGFVSVAIDPAGNPHYEIDEPAAWDAIEVTEALLARAADARAIVFGSLAQRNEKSRATVQRLWSSRALMVFDLNVRPPYDDREIIRQSLLRADVVKLSSDEMKQLATWFDLPSGDREGASALLELFACQVVAVTRGRQGAGLWRNGLWTEHPGLAVNVRDTVGAGDAFLAALIAGLLNGSDSETILDAANRAGAAVAAQNGALAELTAT